MGIGLGCPARGGGLKSLIPMLGFMVGLMWVRVESCIQMTLPRMGGRSGPLWCCRRWGLLCFGLIEVWGLGLGFLCEGVGLGCRCLQLQGSGFGVLCWHPRYVSSLHASPLCGAAPTFLCRRKEK